MDQHGLVDRARRGDRHAFAELARLSGARLDATARLILRDPELAQDACHSEGPNLTIDTRMKRAIALRPSALIRPMRRAVMCWRTMDHRLILRGQPGGDDHDTRPTTLGVSGAFDLAGPIASRRSGTYVLRIGEVLCASVRK